MSFGQRRSSPLTGEIKSVRRDERGQERCMVEFIGFSNAREFKALGKWFSHRKRLKLELVKNMKQEGEKKDTADGKVCYFGQASLGNVRLFCPAIDMDLFATDRSLT